MSRGSIKRVAVASVLVLLVATPIVAQSLAQAITHSTTLEVVPLVRDYESVVLTISGPDDIYIRREFTSAESVAVDLVAELGAGLEDGSYTWEMVYVPRQRSRGDDGGFSVEAAPSRIESGSFTIEGGAMVRPDLPEGGFAKDQVINDDEIVTGSECVGFDCVNGESFGFDTLRLKENNLRLHFDDTSSSASFPRNDWRIVANDSSNGGGEYLAIEDSSAGRQVFRVDAGAPTNSLRVDAQGDVGLGTASPVVELHVVDGDSPTLRLEQDGSSGFTPQTWDLAGNETNFFVRDVTNGSQLPLRIRPSAPTSAIDIASDGDIGIGTSSPDADAAVDILRTDAAITLLEIRNTNATKQNTGVRIDNGAASGAWDFRENTVGQFTINLVGTGALLTIDDNTGNVTIANDLTVTGQCTEVDGACAPDYVFRPDYELRSLDELSEFVTTNQHLPNVPSAAEIEANGINMRRFNFALLEKVEELVLYTLDQQNTIEELKARLEAIEAEKAE